VLLSRIFEYVFCFPVSYLFGGAGLVHSSFVMGTGTPQRCIHLEREKIRTLI